jgi:lipopolysaccharide transport system permease protein
MSKVIYSSEGQGETWRLLAPWRIWSDMLRHRSLIVSVTQHNFRAAYQASYLGVAWQVFVPLIMLAIFYFVFGKILGGRFAPSQSETPIEFALALSIGLGFYNQVAQIISTSPSQVASDVAFVKTLSFPLEILAVTSVLNALLSLVIIVLLAIVILLLTRGVLHPSVICIPFYILCVFLMSLGIAWILSALAVFMRDVAAVTTPMTLILMFMCPIFYPASLVPQKIKWLVSYNPLAVIIEDSRAAVLYGVWPHPTSMLAVLMFSIILAALGHLFFMKSKPAFADVL